MDAGDNSIVDYLGDIGVRDGTVVPFVSRAMRGDARCFRFKDCHDSWRLRAVKPIRQLPFGEPGVIRNPEIYIRQGMGSLFTAKHDGPLHDTDIVAFCISRPNYIL